MNASTLQHERVGAGIVRSLVGRARRRLRPPAVVLLYHRVSELPDAQLLAVAPDRFRRQLEHVARRYRPAGLLDLFEGGAGRGAVAVTFDDGYLDNLTIAKPLLDAAGVPATVFVPAGGLGREQASDVLELCLLGPEAPPPSLTLSLAGRERTWDTTGDVRSAGAWNVLHEFDPTPRHTAYRELHALLRPLPAAERERALESLRRWAGAPAEPRPERRTLAADELVDLARGGTVEVGSHGMHHLVLAEQPEADQRAELASSKHTLEAILHRPVHALAYPYGGPAEIGEHAPRLAREVGYEVACANVPGVVTPRTDRYRVPRVLVGNWDEDEFAERLAAAF